MLEDLKTAKCTGYFPCNQFLGKLFIFAGYKTCQSAWDKESIWAIKIA